MFILRKYKYLHLTKFMENIMTFAYAVDGCYIIILGVFQYSKRPYETDVYPNLGILF